MADANKLKIFTASKEPKLVEISEKLLVITDGKRWGYCDIDFDKSDEDVTMTCHVPDLKKWKVSREKKYISAKSKWPPMVKKVVKAENIGGK